MNFQAKNPIIFKLQEEALSSGKTILLMPEKARWKPAFASWGILIQDFLTNVQMNVYKISSKKRSLEESNNVANLETSFVLN